ncbi:N-glycosylation protein-domain-containing protein [Amylocystis lapponica]|nr:N-glycosylation protein-domain-containing protein [Amylocystis lapponica]
MVSPIPCTRVLLTSMFPVEQYPRVPESPAYFLVPASALPHITGGGSPISLTFSPLALPGRQRDRPPSPPTSVSASVVPPQPSRNSACPPSCNIVGSLPARRRPAARTRSRNAAVVMSAPSNSPPPYSLTPPSPASSTAQARRTTTSSHLHTHPTSQFSTAASLAPASRHDRLAPERDEETSDDEGAHAGPSEGGAVYTVSTGDFSGTLRARVLAKGKARADDSGQLRPITTAPGVLGAGETETEGEDSPRNLPTARIIHPSPPHCTPPCPALAAALLPSLFNFSRLLSIVPAVVGTLYNIFHLVTEHSLIRRIDFFVAVLWSILTGWQCLQLTTGLLKRWRVYYSPLPTLIRLCALQAICWPATLFTLQLLAHDRRPALCWAVVGTTTCCSRSVQLWVTSNIVLAPAEAGMKTGRRRRQWDWAAVGRACALPAGAVYCVMAWAEVLGREWTCGQCACACACA